MAAQPAWNRRIGDDARARRCDGLFSRLPYFAACPGSPPQDPSWVDSGRDRRCARVLLMFPSSVTSQRPCAIHGVRDVMRAGRRKHNASRARTAGPAAYRRCTESKCRSWSSYFSHLRYTPHRANTLDVVISTHLLQVRFWIIIIYFVISDRRSVDRHPPSSSRETISVYFSLGERFRFVVFLLDQTLVFKRINMSYYFITYVVCVTVHAVDGGGFGRSTVATPLLSVAIAPCNDYFNCR